MGKLEEYLKGTTGFIFTNGDLGAIRDIVYANKVPAPARAGGIAPIDVNVPAGPTGCDPGQTSFFQVLQIPTKIVKGQIEITTQVELIKAGDKVGPSEAALLDKLSIMPFEYCLQIKTIFDNGSTYGVEVLDIDNSVLAGLFCSAVRDVAAISLATGIPTTASMPHVFGNTFKDLVSIVVGLDNYSFAEAEPYKAYLADPSAFAAASGGGGGGEAAAAVVEDKGPAEEEVDALEGGMDMFGGGGGDY
jgi:large subunit ribosomal protein LP0